MAEITKQQMEILVKAVDQASGVLREIGGETENLGKKVNGVSEMMRAAMGALSAYAGTKGLMGMISSVEQGNMQLVKARVFLAGNVIDVGKSLAAHEKWADGIRRAGIAGDEYATMIAAKLSPRYKDLQKQQKYAEILLRGERLQLFNAADAAFQMSKGQDGMERTLRWLLDTMGVAVPEIASMSTLWEEIDRKIRAGEEGLSGYATQSKLLSEQIDQLKEVAGKPFVAALTNILTWVNNLIDRYPVLGEVISATMGVVASALTGLGAGLAANSLLKFFGVTVAMAGPWGLVIGAIMGGVIYYLARLGEMSDTTKNTMATAMTSLAAILGATFLAIGGTFFLPFALALGALGVVTRMSLEGYALNWTGFANFLKDTIKGLWLVIGEIWTASIDFLKKKFDEFSTWISRKVEEVLSAVARAASAVARLPGVSSVINAVQSAGSAITNFISGARANGGPVGAGQSYIVGERGPEIFTPAVSGTIIPNGAGGSILIDMRGSTFLDRQAAVQIGDEIIKRLRELHRLSAF